MAYKISDDDSLTRIDDTERFVKLNRTEEKDLTHLLFQKENADALGMPWTDEDEKKLQDLLDKQKESSLIDEFTDIKGHTARKIPGFNTMSDVYTGGIADLDIETKPIFDVAEKYNLDPTDWNISDLVGLGADTYQPKSFGESKTLADYFRGRNIDPAGIGQGVLQAYQLAKKSVPASWIYSAAQNLNFPDFRGGQTQRDYNINRNLNINQSRVGMRSDPRTLRNLQINYARQGLNQDQIDRKIQNFQTVTGQIAGQTGDKEIITPASTVPISGTITAPSPHEQGQGGQGTFSENYSSSSTGGHYSGRGGSGSGPQSGSYGVWGAEGGLIRKKYSEGGIVGLWRELSSL